METCWCANDRERYSIRQADSHVTGPMLIYVPYEKKKEKKTTREFFGLLGANYVTS